jgi:glycosyltransferase involved in cell wall biosynthesis
MTMRIGLNATCFDARPSGANQRFLGIYGTLIRRNPDVDFVIYEPSDQRIASYIGQVPNLIARVTPIPSVGRLARVRAGIGYWSSQLRKDRLDIFEAFHLPLVKAPDCPTILTIHDLRPLRADAPLLTRAIATPVMHRAFSSADHVVAVSNAVAAEIQSFHPSTSVSTIYNGVNPANFASQSAEVIASVRGRYALPEKYVLAIGHIEARKNLPLLIDAIALLRSRGLERHLAMVGNAGGAQGAIRTHIAALNLEDFVTIIEHADDAAVRALYAGCDLVAFPSRYEGFGIPILEAMAAGKPMVLADTPVFRELTLGQSLYFPVDDARAAADAITAVWGDPIEHARQRCFGAKRVADFAFERLADEVRALYNVVS